MSAPMYLKGKYVVTARKPFVCGWCGQLFDSGDLHVLMPGYVKKPAVDVPLVNGQVRVCLMCWDGGK